MRALIGGLFLLALAAPSFSVLFDIKVGAIFHPGDEHLEAVFDEAIKDFHDEMTYPFKIKVSKRVVVRDSYRTYLMACELYAEGIAALFGPRYYQTRGVLGSLSDTFGIPYFEYSYRQTDDEVPLAQGINLYPSNDAYERAIAGVVKHMSFNGFTYLYQGWDALSRVQLALMDQGKGAYPVAFKDLPKLSEIKEMPERQQDLVYESLIKDIKIAGHLSLLIDVETENLAKLLDTMNKMELMSDYFMCFLVNLDATTIDINSYISKDSVANVTYIQFINDETNSMSAEAAVLYDSVFVFADALHNLYKDIDSPRAATMLKPRSLSCDGEAKWKTGLNITEMAIKRTKYGRKTGFISIGEDKNRDFQFDIMNIQAGRTSKIGEWRNGELKISRNEKELNSSLTEAVKNKVFKVSTRVGPPYIMLSEDETKGKLIGDKRYEGYCIDLIAMIEENLGIKCEFELTPDNKYGSYNPRTKQWDGILRQLLDHKADFGICDLTITSERQSAVDFTAPFMNLGISILFSKAEKVKPKLFAFMDPLSVEVWMYTITAYLIFSLLLFFMSRMAPDEWINPHPCNDEPEELENSFNLMNSMWLTIGSLMQQGSDILPRATSIRLLTGTWWFFVLIMVSSYTANLAAFLTAVKMEDSINDIEDLAKQTKISYGALKDGATYSFFKNSNTSLYQRIFNTMADAKPSVFTKSNDEGVERVIKGKRKYAFFMESTSIEYQSERHCELTQVGNLLDNKGYGIAMPPNSPYRTMISTAILHLQEKGELQTLKNKWWKEKGGGLCDDEDDEPVDSNALGIANVGGVFLVLMMGCVVSTLIAIVEFLWNIRKVAIEEKITPKEAFINEVKFLVNISATTKPVKTSKSSSKSTSSKSRSRRSGSKSSKSSKSESINASASSSLQKLDQPKSAKSSNEPEQATSLV